MPKSESPIFRSPESDEEMERAAAQARQTFRLFWRELAWEQRRIIPGLELAAVKGAFSDPPEKRSRRPDSLEVEYMWLLDVDFDGRKIEGNLINSPHSLVTFKEGDRVSLGGKQVVDWLYVIAGKVYGGFTIDVLRSRMGKAERRQHDEAWGFDFGKVGVVNLVPPDYLGEAEQTSLQDFATVAGREHPMSVNMRPSLEKTLTEHPEFLLTTDHHGYSFLHQLALAGSWDGVDVCLKHGADPNLASPSGITPLALARCLGWRRVMTRLEQAGARPG